MIASLALASLLPILAAAVPCVQFDTQWNLYAFGGSQDVKLGQSSSWAQPSATPLTTTGRPPWTGNNTQCMLSQYNNAMYVTGADASDASKIYVYNFAANSWSTQSTSSSPSPLTRSSSVLDHDTNVLFTFSNGALNQLDLSAVTTTATSAAIPWVVSGSPSWASGYSGSVTAAQASNHIMYFGVPNTAAGSAQVFVIHYAYWQPTAQTFTTGSGGQALPTTAGQAVSFPAADGAPTQLVFIPSDFSNSYVVNHRTNPSSYASTDGTPYAANLINTTSILPAPPTKDANAAYAASTSALVQITTSGEINYIANAVGSGTAVSGATWTKMNYNLAGAGSGTASSASASGSASASASGASGSASASRSGSASPSGTASASGGSAAAASSSRAAAMGTIAMGGMGAVGGAAMLAMVAVAGLGMLL